VNVVAVRRTRIKRVALARIFLKEKIVMFFSGTKLLLYLTLRV
jgi:hypothetical protein